VLKGVRSSLKELVILPVTGSTPILTPCWELGVGSYKYTLR
jgi:hypothetical protein